VRGGRGGGAAAAARRADADAAAQTPNGYDGGGDAYNGCAGLH
jgi:hypothetical protein